MFTYNTIYILQIGVYNWLDREVDKRTDKMWAEYFYGTGPTGSVFNLACDAVLGIAITTFMFNLVQQFKIYRDNREDFQLVTKLIVPAIICLSLVGGGPGLKIVIGGLRDVSNNITVGITNQFSATSALNTTLTNSVADDAVVDYYKAEAKKCAELVAATSAARTKCYTDLKTAIDTDPKVLNGGPALGGLKKYSTELASAITSLDPLKALDLIQGALARINPIGIAATALTNLIMSSIAAAIKNGMEISFLLTALIAPLYVALAPLPEGYKALVQWMSGFWSIFVFRLSYSIMVALAGTLYDNALGQFEFQLAIFSAIAAPVLAGILAAGGGMGFYNAAIKVGAAVISKGISFATKG
jgi:hypothetical protein